jgi:hypothetical protein
MATGSNFRVGDADREAAAAQLRDHYADGRLTLDELNERLDLALAAKTKADLNAVMLDLPPVVTGTPVSTAGPGGQGNSWQGPSWQGPRWQGNSWQGDGGGQGSGGWQGAGWHGNGGYRGGMRWAFAPVIGLMWLLVIVGGMFAFGFGGDRPLAIVFILAALALLRRILGFRRRGRGPRGPRGPKGRRRGGRFY